MKIFFENVFQKFCTPLFLLKDSIVFLFNLSGLFLALASVGGYMFKLDISLSRF